MYAAPRSTQACTVVRDALLICSSLSALGMNAAPRSEGGLPPKKGSVENLEMSEVLHDIQEAINFSTNLADRANIGYNKTFSTRSSATAARKLGG